jgi:hypothetical protein
VSSSRRFGRINELARVRSRAQTQRTRKSGLVGEATATTDGGGGRAAGRVIPARSPHHCLLVLDSPTKPNQTTSEGTRPPQPQPRARPPRAHAPPLHFVRGTKAPRHFPAESAGLGCNNNLRLSLSLCCFVLKKKKLALPHGYDGGSPSDRGLPRRKRRVIFSVLPIAPPYIQISPYSYVRAPLLLPI